MDNHENMQAACSLACLRCCADRALPLTAIEPQCLVEDKLSHSGHAKFVHTACRCPYYRTAEHGLYDTLTLGDTDNQGIYFDSYWSSLTTTTLTTSSPDQCGINLPGYPDKFKSAFMADPNNPTCGEYLQFTSQYPGKGPCYPVLAPTVDHLNRCYSISSITPCCLCFALCCARHRLDAVGHAGMHAEYCKWP